MLLIIWAKNGNFFQKCTEKPLTAWTKSVRGFIQLILGTKGQIQQTQDVHTQLLLV